MAKQPDRPDPKAAPPAEGANPEKGPALNPPGGPERAATPAPDTSKPDAVTRLTAPLTPTGEKGPEPGNVDDLSETRTAGMGKPPAFGGAAPIGPDPTGGTGSEDEVTRLRRENRRLKRLLATAVEDDEPARAAGAPVEVPGEGPVLWAGSMPTDRILGFSGPHTKPLRFRGPENEAEAREHFKRHAGIAHTEHKIVLTRVPDGDGG